MSVMMIFTGSGWMSWAYSHASWVAPSIVLLLCRCSSPGYRSMLRMSSMMKRTRPVTHGWHREWTGLLTVSPRVPCGPVSCAASRLAAVQALSESQ